MLPAATLLVALASGCASPIEGLWPPAPGEPFHRVVVLADRWHTVVGQWPADDPGGADPAGYREWGYADRAYYHEGDDGSCGVLGAIFLPGPGVVLLRADGKSLAEWSPQPPVRRWEFRLTPAGHRALLDHLEGEKTPGEPFDERKGLLWYEATRSYHGFHHCHHFTLRALRAAGLPVFASLALLRPWTFAQLDRAERMGREAAEPRPPAEEDDGAAESP